MLCSKACLTGFLSFLTVCSGAFSRSFYMFFYGAFLKAFLRDFVSSFKGVLKLIDREFSNLKTHVFLKEIIRIFCWKLFCSFWCFLKAFWGFFKGLISFLEGVFEKPTFFVLCSFWASQTYFLLRWIFNFEVLFQRKTKALGMIFIF